MNITIPNLYDSDYQLWLENTINQLRQGDFKAVDWQNLLEELADLGKNNRRALKPTFSRLFKTKNNIGDKKNQGTAKSGFVYG
jgi:hypothetical protein